MDKNIFAPWDEKTVRLLRLYQENEKAHPYTCGTNGCKSKYGWVVEATHLIPTECGWICPKCDYKQKWVSASVLEWIDGEIKTNFNSDVV